MMRKGNGDDEVPESVNVLKSRRRDPFAYMPTHPRVLIAYRPPSRSPIL